MKTAGSRVGIPPRKMVYNPDQVELQTYYDDDKVMTVFWNTLSMLFPEGEQFFVESIRAYRERIGDQTLRDQISGFIGQEALHTLAHNQLNDKLKAAGYPVDRVNTLLGKALKGIRKKHPLLALHATAILEHYTSTLAIQLLDDQTHNGSVKGESRKIWIHHAVEEFEHRTVSFDVLERVGGPWSHEVRMALFVPVSVIFAAVTAVLFGYNFAKSKPRVKDMVGFGRLFRLLFANGGKLRDWFSIDFHPSHHTSKGYEAAKKELEIS